MNKESFVLSFTERMFIQTRRFWRVCLNEPIEAFVIAPLQLIKKQVFLSAIIKEFAHAFSCAYIGLWVHLGSLERTQEARVALPAPRAILTHLSCSPNFSRASTTIYAR